MRYRVIPAAIAAAFSIATAVQAQTAQGGDYTLTRQSIAGGGNRAQGVNFVAEVPLSQPAARRHAGGEFVLNGGFQMPEGTGVPIGDDIFSNGFEG